VTLDKLTPQETYGLWLVDAGTGGAADTNVRLATVRATGTTATVTGSLNAGVALPEGFMIDRVVVAPGTVAPTAALASGSLNVFQKVFFRRLSLANEGTASILLDETTPAPRFFDVVPDLAAEGNLTATAISPRTLPLDRLIARGATLFFEETFAGNGRTCGTCHPAHNNFTIDPKFIATLPKNDPLFVAEFNSQLRNLEKPELMRKFGLILENVDGLEDPTRKFVMRGVPHTLGLQVSMAQDANVGEKPTQMTGWSGDGAPGNGSLREFAIGAVTQHFTKRLSRVAGVDFRLPTEGELDAMEAFQLSLGRAEDIDLSTMTFLDPNVQAGKNLFVNGTGRPEALGSCGGFCHVNAGALSPAGPTPQNLNLDSNVEEVPHPARQIFNFPRDGGFGQTANKNGGFGDDTFNVASVVEAADTPPFFHNNVVNTLEDVVRFYSSDTFNETAGGDPTFMFDFRPGEITQIASFMRAINAFSDIGVSRRELVEILANRGDPRSEQNARLATAFEEIGDAIKVLNEGRIFAGTVTHLTGARNFVVQAQRSTGPLERRALIAFAIGKLVQARNTMATVAN
jgi:hypothetical protein